MMARPARTGSIGTSAPRVEASVSEPIEAFFEQLSVGPGSLPPRASGSLRVDLESGATTERWFLTIGKGAVSVSHRNAKADAVIRTSKDVFEGIVAGKVNAMAGALRGVVSLEGDPTLLVLFQRALPGPPSPAGRGTMTRGRRS
jgi:SCP-2 sterol transfer family